MIALKGVLRPLFAAAVAPLLLFPMHGAKAQAYPSQDIHFICGFTAGSGPDDTARFLAEKLRAKWGKTVIVDNKPGAVGNIATEFVAKAKPDGHTLYMTGGSSLVATA